MRIRVIIFFALLSGFCISQQSDSAKISSDSLKKIIPHKFLVRIDSLSGNVFDLNYNWIYSNADSRSFSQLFYDDSKWDTLNTHLYEKQIEHPGFNGLGWFRLHFILDTSQKKI